MTSYPLDLSKVPYKESPNKSNRASGKKPTHIVLHHTGPGSFNGIVSWLRNPSARASAHYVLGKAGQLNQLVNTRKKAWHAGRSVWAGISDVNQYSIGIEICNIGILDRAPDGDFYYEVGREQKKYTGKSTPVKGSITLNSGKVIEGYYVPYPEKQIKKLIMLCKGIVKKYPDIKRENIITHYQICIPEGRKVDPFGLDIEKIKDEIFGI